MCTIEDISVYLRRNIDHLTPYIPGKSEEEVMESYHLSEVVKLASNENPMPPPKAVLEAIAREASKAHRYPDGKCRRLAAKLASFFCITPEQLVFGNRAEELIFMICQSFLNEREKAVLVDNCFDAYESAVRIMGGDPLFSPLTPDYQIDLHEVLRRITPLTKLVFLPNPNNPTGTIFTDEDFQRFIKAIPKKVLVVLDEAYHEYVSDPRYPNGIRYMKEGYPIIILRTFSKFYGLAGIRIGYAIANEAFVKAMNYVRQPFNVNRIAEAAACAALDQQAWFREQTLSIDREKTFLYRNLDEMGIFYVPSHTNFILIDVQKDAEQVFKGLLKKGVIVRPGSIWGFNTHLRVTVGTHRENVKFLESLKEVIE